MTIRPLFALTGGLIVAWASTGPLYGSKTELCTRCDEPYSGPGCAQRAKEILLIPVMMNGHSGHRDHRFRSSRSLIGAKRGRQFVS